MVLVILSASVKRCSVSCMQDFSLNLFLCGGVLGQTGRDLKTSRGSKLDPESLKNKDVRVKHLKKGVVWI